MIGGLSSTNRGFATSCLSSTFGPLVFPVFCLVWAEGGRKVTIPKVTQEVLGDVFLFGFFLGLTKVSSFF